MIAESGPGRLERFDAPDGLDSRGTRANPQVDVLGKSPQQSVIGGQAGSTIKGKLRVGGIE